MKEVIKLMDNKPVRYALSGLVIVIVTAVVYYLYLKVSDSLIETKKNLDVKRELNEEINEDDLTTTTTQYKTISDKMYAAMQGMGTDEEAIFSAFDMVNSHSDLMQVIQIFGEKDEMSMQRYLQSELDQSDIDKINNKLSTKNINFNF